MGRKSWTEEIQVRRDIWIFLTVIGILLFSWPIMSIFRDSLTTYLFVIWIIFIALIFVISLFSEREDGNG
jgi:uncharacterized membrane protein